MRSQVDGRRCAVINLPRYGKLNHYLEAGSKLRRCMHRAISLLPSPSFLSLSPLLILLLRLCSSPFSHCSSRFILSVPFLSSFHSSRINAIIFRTFSFSFLCATLFCYESTHVRSFFYQCAVFTRVLLCPSFFLALSQPTLNRIVHSSLFLHPSESLQLSNASTFFSPAFVFYYCFRRSFSPRFKLSILFPLNYYNVRSKSSIDSLASSNRAPSLSAVFFITTIPRRTLFLLLLFIQATSARVSRASTVLPPDGIEEQVYVHIRKFRYFAARNRSLSTLADLET